MNKVKEIRLEIPEGKRAEWVNNILTLVDDEPHYGDIRDKIKTFEDAEKATGMHIPQWAFHLDDDIIAYMKMTIIVKALNEGWKPQFTPDEYRWFPHYYLYNKEQIDDMNEEDKKDIVLFSNSVSLAYAYSSNAWSVVGGDIGSCFALKNKELAIYFGKQFIGIIKDFIFHN